MSLVTSVEKALSKANIAATVDGENVRCRLNGMKYTIKTEIVDLDDRNVGFRSHQSGMISETTKDVINNAMLKSGLCEEDEQGNLIWTFEAMELAIS